MASSARSLSSAAVWWVLALEISYPPCEMSHPISADLQPLKMVTAISRSEAHLLYTSSRLFMPLLPNNRNSRIWLDIVLFGALLTGSWEDAIKFQN